MSENNKLTAETKASINNNYEKKLINVKIVSELTGWGYEDAKRKMDELLKKGINYETYINKKFYLLSKKKAKKEIKKVLKKEKQYVVNVSKLTGWSKRKTLKEMQRVKEKFGINFFKYYNYRFFTLTDDEIAQKVDLWKKTLNKQISFVMQESGWSKPQIKYHMRKVRTVYDFSADYYVLYRMWELEDKKISTYAKRKDSDRLFAKYNNKKACKIIKNKDLFNKKFNDYTKRKFWVNKRTNYKKFLEFIEGLDYIFCKPVDSGGGQGTEKIKLSSYKNKKKLYDYLMSKEKILVEECVKQHQELEKFAPGSVNTTRVVTLLKDNKCHIICASIRFGNKGFVDNFHKDGMTCDVDISTGKIVTPAIDRNGIVYEKHPVSGYKFVDFQIPNWDLVLELAEAAIRHKKGINYVGWDIAICKDKALIIEGNSAPDLASVQASYSKEKIGKRYLFEPFFK